MNREEYHRLLHDYRYLQRETVLYPRRKKFAKRFYSEYSEGLISLAEDHTDTPPDFYHWICGRYYLGKAGTKWMHHKLAYMKQRQEKAIDMPISSKRIKMKLKPGQPGEATPVKDSDLCGNQDRT